MKWLIFPLILLSILMVLSSCGGVITTVYYQLVSNISNGAALPPNSYVRVSVEDGNGNPAPSVVELYRDGELIQTFQAEDEHNILVKDEGKYKIKVKVENTRYEAVLNFKITNFEREIYVDGGRFYIDHWPGVIGNHSVESLKVRFYKQVSREIGTQAIENYTGGTETVYNRVRLKLVDTNGDGVFDEWEEVETSSEQGWIDVPKKISYWGYEWNIYAFEYAEDHIYLIYTAQIGGSTYSLISRFADVGFDLNNYYSRYISSDTWSYYYYDNFMLRERYDGDKKPIFALNVKNKEDEYHPGEVFDVDINATNVGEYANLYDVRFMKLVVKYPKGLVLTGVDFGNFMDGMEDACSYKKSETSVVLYRGFLYGEDENGALTDVFATLHFKVATDATENSDYQIQLVYEPWFDTYSDYPDTPNPVFKDEENSYVDGFILDHDPVVINVGGGL